MRETTGSPPRWGDVDFDERLNAVSAEMALSVLNAEFESPLNQQATGSRPMMMNSDYQWRLRSILDRQGRERLARDSAAYDRARPAGEPIAKKLDPDTVFDDPTPIPDPSRANAPPHRVAFLEKILVAGRDVERATIINEVKFLSDGAKGIDRIMLARYLLALRRAVADELEALRKRVAELEARPEMKYCGVFEDDRAYSPGEFVTHAGSIWHCRSATAGGRPGSSASWQLAVKRGKDAG